VKSDPWRAAVDVPAPAFEQPEPLQHIVYGGHAAPAART
jgi:hypothetical protein